MCVCVRSCSGQNLVISSKKTHKMWWHMLTSVDLRKIQQLQCLWFLQNLKEKCFFCIFLAARRPDARKNPEPSEFDQRSVKIGRNWDAGFDGTKGGNFTRPAEENNNVLKERGVWSWCNPWPPGNAGKKKKILCYKVPIATANCVKVGNLASCAKRIPK